MIPTAAASSFAMKPAQHAPVLTAQKAAQPPSPETLRTSAGEAGAANLRAETPDAIQAPEQGSVAPRLRDRETVERSQRAKPEKDAPTGPPPAFEESPLERQARVALDPPEQPQGAEAERAPEMPAEAERAVAADSEDTASEQPDPPPTPTERAERSFAETRGLAEIREPTVDVAR